MLRAFHDGFEWCFYRSRPFSALEDLLHASPQIAVHPHTHARHKANRNTRKHAEHVAAESVSEEASGSHGGAAS